MDAASKPVSPLPPASSSAVTPTPSKGKLKQRLGFVGAGQMALALAKGFMASGYVSPANMMVSAPSDRSLPIWQELGVPTTKDNAKVFRECDVIFLAVKPHIFKDVTAALEVTLIEEENAAKVEALPSPKASSPQSTAGDAVVAGATESNLEESEWEGGGSKMERAKKAALQQQQKQQMGQQEDGGEGRSSRGRQRFITDESKLYVSVMAGLKIKTLTNMLKHCVREPRVIRSHPNTPVTVQQGCAVFSLGETATEEDADIVRKLFETVGIVEMVPEIQQDAFTGMAGSGPAYVFTFLEALSDGGVRMGLPRELASRFAAQMTLGAAKMCLEGRRHPAQLRDAVTSPGGTTIRGVQALERAGVRGAVMDAVQASAERANELGEQNDHA